MGSSLHSASLTTCDLRSLLTFGRNMALPMKKTVMKSAMKSMKSMKATAMKTKAMKKKAVSKIAKGKLAKVVVFKGNKEKTASGFAKADLMKNKRGKIVTKRQNAAGKKAYKHISAWTTACQKARKELGIKGFCPVGRRGQNGSGQGTLRQDQGHLWSMRSSEAGGLACVVVHGASGPCRPSPELGLYRILLSSNRQTTEIREKKENNRTCALTWHFAMFWMEEMDDLIIGSWWCIG